ncbi:hypothetical protein ILUMI_13601 [Ignelater luminosus]|uniref:Uncharacterized protein n=1 Tax=Ignelater luminosus TaxID=2038154 RepID=A0A8K0CS26_IGNLU|nr:hypothetical protein ILUMI_13601 [Ignelater luminosus]
MMVVGPGYFITLVNELPSMIFQKYLDRSILWLFSPVKLSQPFRKRDCTHLIGSFRWQGISGFICDLYCSNATSVTSVITNTSLDAPSTSSSVAPTNNCYEKPVMPPHQFMPSHVIQPYPNVKRNDDIRKGRKRQSTQVLTGTPIRNELAEIENKRNLSKPTKEKKVDFSDTSGDSVSELPEFGNSDNGMSIESEEAKTCEKLKVNGFVLVRFATKKQVKDYVGQVKKILQDELIIINLKKKERQICVSCSRRCCYCK